MTGLGGFGFLFCGLGSSLRPRQTFVGDVVDFDVKFDRVGGSVLSLGWFNCGFVQVSVFWCRFVMLF